MRMLVFGDSITQGFNDEVGGGWCNRLVSHLLRKDIESNYTYNKSAWNLGVSGDNTDDLLKRVRTETEARLIKYPTKDYDIALLAIGINDSLYELSTGECRVENARFQSNLKQIVTVLREYVKEVFVVEITPVAEHLVQPIPWKPEFGYSNQLINAYNDALRNFVQANDLSFISTQDLFMLNPEAYLSDGLHLNAVGHQTLYKRVIASLEAKGIL